MEDEETTIDTTSVCHECEEDIHVLDVMLKARDKAMSEIFKRYYIQKMYDDPDSYPIQLRQAIKYITSDSGTPPYYFITVNPPPECPLDKLLQQINKFLGKKWITHYAYVIEQRGETEEEAGKGLHTHILIHSNNYPPARMRKEMCSTFAKIMTCNANNPYVVFIRDDEQYKIRLTYLNGLKTEEKKEKVKIDKYYREKNKLLNIYTDAVKI